MNSTAQLLASMSKNVEMGVGTIDHLRELATDRTFIERLDDQYHRYQQLAGDIQSMQASHGYEQTSLSPMEKWRTDMMISMKTLMDKSDSHLAEMLTIGSTMGVVAAIRNAHQYDDAEREALALNDRMKKAEEDHLHTLKEFL